MFQTRHKQVIVFIVSRRAGPLAEISAVTRAEFSGIWKTWEIFREVEILSGHFLTHSLS